MMRILTRVSLSVKLTKKSWRCAGKLFIITVMTTDSQSIDEPSTPFNPPWTGMDLRHADVIIDLFDRAAKANLASKHRTGSVANLPANQQVLITGDLHDHGMNFQRILKLAELHVSDQNHVILHEIVHGESRVNGRDMSIRTLGCVAALKLAYPDQVHIMQSNHDLAQMLGEGILKDSISVIDSFNDGVDFIYADEADDVRDAMNGFIHSYLMAVRCPNDLFISHSLPSPQKLPTFDWTLLDRVPTDEDLQRTGSGYHMVWGRNHTEAFQDKVCEELGVKLFVMGHQPADMGYVALQTKMLVLASDHSHGMVLPLRTSKSYTMDDLIELMIPLASVVM